ncbi:hypothetical protein CABS03_07645 [Colletotrichum abscissum]
MRIATSLKLNRSEPDDLSVEPPLSNICRRAPHKALASHAHYAWGGSAFRAERDRKIIGSRAGRAMLRPKHFAPATSRPAEDARLIQRIEGFSRSEGHEDLLLATCSWPLPRDSHCFLFS